jgi:hypothetical protein
MTDTDGGGIERATSKPWLGNRYGDPHQLLHEAAQLEALAQSRRKEAARLRSIAAEEEGAADRIEGVARDYRRWANERKYHD